MFSRQEKIILALMAAINFTHIVDFMIMMPLGPQLMRMFQIEPHQFGMLVSVYTFCAGISGFLTSLFVDRFPRKSALLFFYAGFTVATIACAFADNYPFLLFARGLTGTFGGVAGSLVLSVVGDAVTVERRGTAMGVVMGSFSVASVFGVPFSLYLANRFTWHAPFLFLGGAAVLIAIFVTVLMPKMSDHLKGPHSGQEKDPFFALKHIAQTPNQMRALAFMFFLVLGQFSVIPFISASFVSNAGLAEASLPMIYLTGGLVSMIASPAFGRLADKIGKKKVFYAGALSSIIPILLITHIVPVSTFLLMTISGSFFLVMSGRMVPAMAIISSAAPPRYRGSFMSVSASVQQLSAALASYVAGAVVYKDEAGRLINYSLVGWGAALFSVLAVLTVRKVQSMESVPRAGSGRQ